MSMQKSAAASPHVLFVSQEYAPAPPVGGIGTFTRSVARALVVEGCRVTVLSCGSGAAPGETTDEGVTVHRMPLGRWSVPMRALRRFLPHTASRVMLSRSAARAARMLGLRPDVVEAPEWGAEGLFMKRAVAAPLIVHLHSPLQALWGFHGKRVTFDVRLAGRLERFAARRADLVTAGSRIANRTGPRRSLVPADQVRIVPMPTDPELLAAPLAGWPRERLLVATGRLEGVKAPEVLVEAAARLTTDYPDLRLVLVGEANPLDTPAGHADYASWLGRLAGDLGVAIELPGRLPWDRVIDLYRRARCVVVPSRHETFSMVALEAMTCGTPVVVTSACGIAEHLGGFGAGWVVPPDDPTALAAALRPLLDSDEYAAARGAAAAAMVREKFSPAIAARARMSAYAALCAGRG